jgi:hypothetical protein
MERIKQLESFPTTNQNGHNGSKKEPKEGYNKRSKGTSDNKKSATGKWCCTFHKSDTHNMEDCKVLNAKKGDNKPPYKNKTWKKEADKSKNYTRKELNALPKKLVNEEKKAWGKDQKADNKRKNKKSTRSRKSSLPTAAWPPRTLVAHWKTPFWPVWLKSRLTPEG